MGKLCSCQGNRLVAMNRPTLAVLITYHNEGHLLTQCLRSLWDQSDRPDEILIYDDASDLPPSDYVPRDVRAKIIRGEANLGPGIGRNRLLAHSECEFVHFHDSDDLFASGWCAAIRSDIALHDADLILTNVASFSGPDQVSSQVLPLELLSLNADLTSFSIENPILVPSGTFRRREAIEMGGFRSSLWQAEDYDFYIRLSSRTNKWRSINAPLVRIRIRPDSRSKDRSAVYKCALKSIRLLAEELPSKYRPDLSNAAAKFAAHLFQLGLRDDAGNAFTLAFQIGTPNFAGRSIGYKILSHLVGPLRAEEAAAVYRSTLPIGLRRIVHRLQSL